MGAHRSLTSTKPSVHDVVTTPPFWNETQTLKEKLSQVVVVR